MTLGRRVVLISLNMGMVVRDATNGILEREYRTSKDLTCGNNLSSSIVINAKETALKYKRLLYGWHVVCYKVCRGCIAMCEATLGHQV